MSVLLELPEDLDAAAMEGLRPTFEALARSADDVELDLSSVRFIDSSGVGGIVFLFKRLRASGHSLWLTHVGAQPRSLLAYVGLLPLTTRPIAGARS